jgi:hypothetical protein
VIGRIKDADEPLLNREVRMSRFRRVDGVEGLAEVVRDGVGGGDVVAGLDLDSAVAAGGAKELADGPAGLALDPARDGQGSEHDCQVDLDEGPAGGDRPGGPRSSVRAWRASWIKMS